MKISVGNSDNNLQFTRIFHKNFTKSIFEIFYEFMTFQDSYIFVSCRRFSATFKISIFIIFDTIFKTFHLNYHHHVDDGSR